MLDASNLREQIIQESNDNLLAQIKTLKVELDLKTIQMEEEGLYVIFYFFITNYLTLF